MTTSGACRSGADCVFVAGNGNVIAGNGNVADNCARFGFLVGGSGNSLIGNLASRCSIGLQLGQASSGNVAKLNRATATTSGISVVGSGQTVTDSVVDLSNIGFEIGGSGHSARGLVAVGNLTGIAIFGDDLTLASSAVTGNKGAGIDVVESTTGVVISKTNMVGNGTQFSPNCGLVVRNGSSVTAGF